MADSTVIEQTNTTETPAAAPQTAAPAGETLLAGKFKDAGELEKAYKALESKLGQRTVSSEVPSIAAPKPPGGDSDASDIPSMLKAAGLDPESVAATWTRDGDLTPEQYKAIEDKHGIRRGAAKAMARGYAAEQALGAQVMAQAKARAAELVGGDEALSKLLNEEAPKHLNPSERKMYNEMLRDGTTMDAAVLGIKAMVEARSGNKGPAPINGDNKSVHTGGFQSADEFVKAQRAAKTGTAADRDRFTQMVRRTPQDTINGWMRQ